MDMTIDSANSAGRAYSSCWWLQDHIEFSFGDDIRACCYNYVDAKGRTVGNVHLVDVHENRFPAEEIISRRRKIHHDIEAGMHQICLGCPELRRKNWPASSYLAKFITMNVWSHCNLKCYYCAVSAPGFHATHVTYDVVAVISDMLKGNYVDPGGMVAWGGGDISALPEFNDLSLLYLDYGISQSFKTSAFKFLPGLAQALAKNRGAVEVSVDAGTPETFAHVKGKDAFDRVVRNIARYREYGRVDLKYIAGVDHIEDDDIYGFVGLVTRLTPEVVTVTPEWSAHWTGRYTAHHIQQVAKLIYRLKETGVRVIPETRVDGERLFPGSWPEIEKQIALLDGVARARPGEGRGWRDPAAGTVAPWREDRHSG